MSKYEHPKSNLSSLLGACPFLALRIDFLYFNFFPFSRFTVYFSLEVLSTLSFLFPSLILSAPLSKVKPTWHRTDSRFISVRSVLSIDSLCLNLPLSHLSVFVSLVYQVQRFVPSTWSSWLRCLMGGSRSRNHLSLFGRLFQMKSSQSQGADGYNQFMHLCSGCYRRTVRRKQYYEQSVFNSAIILLYKGVFCRLQFMTGVWFHNKRKNTPYISNNAFLVSLLI